MSFNPNARISLVGAGPGDPELITLKGLRALQTADAVLYDALASKALLSEAPRESARIFVGKRKGHKTWSQDAINVLLVETARQRGHVVRLKGGDPFVFGRGYEEMEFAQKNGIPAQYIPGISSAVAVPGLAGIPVTHRNLSRSCWIVTATCSDGSLSADLRQAAASDATVVVLMGWSKPPEIIALFAAAGKSALPAAVLQNGSLPESRAVYGRVEDILQKTGRMGIGSPAVLVFGPVAALRENELHRIVQSANF
jgi:uroporphyrin-III C-methyltransferase